MMCTETCPCFYEVTFEENANQVQTYRSDAYYKYQQLSEDAFAYHERVFKSTNQS